MKIKYKTFRAIGTLTAAAFIAGALTFASGTLPGLENAAHAQTACGTARPKQKIAPQMTPDNYKVFEAAQIEMDAENYTGALQIIDEFLARRGLSPYEEAMGHQIKGLSFYYENNIPQAIQEFKIILQYPEIPYATQDSIRYALSQFYFNAEDYVNSLKYLDEWLCYQLDPNPQSLVYKSQVHYNFGQDLIKANRVADGKSNYQKGVVAIEKAISIAEADPTIEVLENWLQTQFALYFALEDYRKAAEITEKLIVKWPRPQYWTQLSSLYGELEEYTKQLAVLDVAYRLGFLEKEVNLIAIAQMYNINGAPYLGAAVMEDNMKPRQVDGKTVSLIDPEDEQNQLLVGQAWLSAKEYKKSTGPLEKAAALSDEGQIYLQLGSVYSTLEDWSKAATALNNALKKGDLSRPDQTYMFLGIAYVSTEDFAKAEKAFRDACREARKQERSCRGANGWLDYIKAEKARLKRLADAGLR